MPRSLSLLACVALLVLQGTLSWAKTVVGDLKLSSENSEQYIDKFSFSRKTPGTVAGHFFSKDQHYFNGQPHDLQVVLMSEAEFQNYQRMMQEGSLCSERIRHVSLRKRIQPAANQPSHRPTSAVDNNALEFQFKWHIVRQKDSHYWYLFLMDCYLENYPAHPPTLSYDVEFFNGKSHLPSDERGLKVVHMLVTLVFLAGSVIVGLSLYSQYQTTGQIHLSGFALWMATVSQMVASLCETSHLLIYEYNGLGLRWRHSWIPADFLADFSQNISETIMITLIISICFGWMLNTGFSRARWAFMFGMMLLVLQGALTMLSRRYEDDFGAFHDFEHVPGQLLMALRMSAIVLVWVGYKRTSKSASDEVRKFLLQFACLGTAWLVSFPVVTLLWAPFLVNYNRHVVVTVLGITLQALALFLMGFMLLSNASDYFKLSSLSQLGTVFQNPTSGLGTGGVMKAFQSKVAVD